MASVFQSVYACLNEKKETCSREECVRARACACVRAINLINLAAALSHSHFYRSGEQPATSETKGNVESSSEDR